MTSNQSTRTNAFRRLIAGMILGVAPMLVAIDTAATAYADTTVSTPDPGFHAPVHHQPFPTQHDDGAPGTPAHHHHQHRHGR